MTTNQIDKKNIDKSKVYVLVVLSYTYNNITDGYFEIGGKI